jgi:hypothetical protein
VHPGIDHKHYAGPVEIARRGPTEEDRFGYAPGHRWLRTVKDVDSGDELHNAWMTEEIRSWAPTTTPGNGRPSLSPEPRTSHTILLAKSSSRIDQ